MSGIEKNWRLRTVLFFFLNSFCQHCGRRQRRQDAQRGEAWCVEKGLLNGEKGLGRSHLGQP